MSEFNFKSQICTSREQSERLLALGLKKETADMGFRELGNGWREYFVDRDVYNLSPSKIFPTWSLHRLIEMMPTTINNMLWFNATHYTALYDSIDYIKSFEVNDNLYDNIIDCIGWLIKEGYFNKEYLV